MARGSDGESVLHKHLRILDAFDAMHPVLSLREIADASGLAPSTAHRLLAELEREGLVERTNDRSFQLGVRLWEFASRTPGALGLRERAHPWFDAVHARVRQHTQLGVLSGVDVLFIDRSSTRDAVVSATLIGGRIPLPVSSCGMVLLAAAEPTVVDEVIAHGWPRHTRFTTRDGAELRERLRHVRADGYAVLSGHIHERSRGIAVPIVGPLGAVYASIGVVVANDDASPGATIELLTLAASGISQALAGPAGTRVPLVSTSVQSLEYLASLTPNEPAFGRSEQS
jgi:DNA-binding IclR family transcriptional regulator